ncbi:MAG TPA: hypothetical protein VHN36_04730 [Ilumatobacteraceae bacterium]|nr:hypothetical protein [Ilumatobacteraceae bacterium]
MASAPRHLSLDRIVGPFAHLLLAADLPRLPDERRLEVVGFVQRRADAVPSFTRFGITMIAVVYRAIMVVPGGRGAARFIAARPLPVLAEYPRLIRSLAYAYVWERWPDTRPDGAAR